MLVKKVWIHLVFFLVIVSCRNDHYQYVVKPQPGISLSFDDAYVDEWFSLRDLFLRYNARVTFFISNFDSLSVSQIEKLKILQQDGHEIAFHGALHVVSEFYIKKYSMNEYIEHEIVEGIKSMNNAGFYPTSFAYPYGAKYWGTDRELLKYFYLLREVSSFKTIDDITEYDEAYYPFDGSRLISSLPIDKNGGLTAAMIDKAMIRCKNNREALLLFGHTPFTDTHNVKYSFDVAFLEQILKLSNEHNLKFFCASDLVR